MTVVEAQPVPLNARLTKLADWLAVAAAASLPWSTSVTGILVGTWIVVALLTLDRESVERVRWMAAAALPIAIVVYAVLALAWSDVAWPVRLRSLPPVAKLAVIPLLFIHFRRTGASGPVFVGFFISCCVLLVASWLLAAVQVFFPQSHFRFWEFGVPVRDYIIQSGLFSLCGVFLLDRAIATWKASPRFACGYAAVAVLFLANIVFVATGRTSLVALAVLLVVLGFRRFRSRALIVFLGLLVMLATVSWLTSPYLRHRVTNVISEIRDFRPHEVDTSSGARLEFWRHSLKLIPEAPLFGHGAGSTREVMSRSFGVDPKSAGAPTNPHNQIFAMAIPYGLIGVALLIAMWGAHLRLFLEPGSFAFIGLIVVTQNIVGGLFNSHLFDFTQGWLYVLGVGAAGGALMYRRDADKPQGDSL